MAGFFDDNAPPADWVDPGYVPGAQTPAPTGGGAAPSPSSISLYDAVAQIYRTALGREGSADEINQWIQGTGGNLAQIQQGIYASPEAAEASKRQQATGAASSTGTGSTSTSSPLAGWDADKWNDPNHNSPKYVVGRILAKYPPTTAGLAQAWNEIHGAYPSATFDGKDSISGIPGTLGAVDVLAGASQGGTGWWWGDQGAAGAGGAGAGGAAGGASGGAASGGSGLPGLGDFQNTPDRYTSPMWTGGDYQQLAKPAGLQNPYTLPTQAELEASPGYQSRLAAGLQARDRSAAAKGTVLNGGTQQALARYGQDYASNEYGNLVSQTMGARQVNYGEYNTDDANAFRNYQSRYGQFQDTVNNGRTDYALNTTTQRNARNDIWQHLQDLYSTGANLAGGSYKPGVQS